MLGQSRTIRFDFILLFTVLALAGLGILNLYSIPGSHQAGRHLAQTYWLAFGVGVALVIWAVDYRLLLKLAYPMYIASIIMLVLLMVGPESIAPVTKGARRWLVLGGLRFQPSEFTKLALIMLLARHFHEHPQKGGYSLLQIAYPLLLTLVPMALVLKQPDLGTALLLLFITMTMVLFAKLRMSALIIIGVVGLVALPVTWTMLKPFQKDRIIQLFNPTSDQLKKKGWQSQQGVIATSSGGLTGKGFRKGPQTQFKFVPEQWNDFAFSGWAEEWGFLGCAFVLALYFFFLVWGLSVSGSARERLGAFLAVGCTGLIFWHVFVNIAMVIRILPVVGIPLPFFSYGGSALLTMMFAVGLLLSVSARRRT